MKRLLLLLLLLFWAAACGGQPSAGLDQRVGASVPLDLAVRDDLGRAQRLADYFRPREPVLLVLGYYRCPELCGLVMHSLLEAAHGTGLPPERWRIVGLSIDPHDAPADAHQRREADLAYAHFLQLDAPRLDLLVAAPSDVQRVAAALGLRARAEGSGFAHPATVAVLTPAGTVARYFNGIGHNPAELRTALVAAANERTGAWTDRLALLCAHLLPAAGSHTQQVMAAARGLALLTMASIALLVWRQRRKRSGP